MEERQTKRKIVWALKQKIQQEAFRDPIYAETVCLTSHVTLRNFGYEQFGEKFSTTFIPPVDRGYVLCDGYGTGVQQLICRHGGLAYSCAECRQP